MLDTVQPIIEGAINYINEGKADKAIPLLYQVQALCDVHMALESKWDFIKEDYERGVRVRILAYRYKVSAKQISDKAYRDQWVSPSKLRRILTPPASSGQRKIRLVLCRECGNHYEAWGGRSCLCETCKFTMKQAKLGLPSLED